MAASAWALYNPAKKHIGDGTIDLNTNNFQMGLYTSASNCADPTLEVIGSVTNELPQLNGYTTSGKPLTGITWGPTGSPDTMKFSSAAVSWLVSGGDITDIKYAVVQQVTGGLLLCYATLSDIPFAVTNGNTLTLTPSSSGYFELR